MRQPFAHDAVLTERVDGEVRLRSSGPAVVRPQEAAHADRLARS